MGTAPLGDDVYGKINNVTGSEHEALTEEGWGPIGPDNWDTETHRLTDFQFDLLDWSHDVDTLGPGAVYMNVYLSYRDDAGDLVTQIVQVVGYLSLRGRGTWNREADTPRTMTMKPFRRIIGGGANKQDLSKANCGEYLDTHTGEYLTRLAGTGAQVDHFAAMRTAHGL